MRIELYDDTGLLSRTGKVLRLIALMAGLTSGIAVLPVGLIALFSPMACGGGCTTIEAFAMQLVWVSLILFISSAAAGLIGFSKPSWGTLLLAMVSPILAIIPFALAP